MKRKPKIKHKSLFWYIILLIFSYRVFGYILVFFPLILIGSIRTTFIVIIPLTGAVILYTNLSKSFKIFLETKAFGFSPTLDDERLGSCTSIEAIETLYAYGLPLKGILEFLILKRKMYNVSEYDKNLYKYFDKKEVLECAQTVIRSVWENEKK